MIYTIIEYVKERDLHTCIDEDDKLWNLDLSTDGSFPEINNYIENEKNYTRDKYIKFMKSLKGNKFSAKKIFPYIPIHFVKDGKWIKT